MKVVLFVFKHGKRCEFPLNVETTVLGRRSDCNLRVQTSDVSRRHCQLVITDDQVLVKDLGSSNGTYVNGKRIAETSLSPGDRLTVGPVVFVVQIDGQPAEIEPADAEVDMSGAPASAPLIGDDVDIFELGEDDFDIEDAISSLDELDQDKDLP